MSIYGRSISEDRTGKHFYLPGPHQGLYPKYPEAAAKKLILTEAVIDEATLNQYTMITTEYSVLACYGTNGFTQEHEQAIKALRHLEEVILFFDGDEAGKEGAKKLAVRLQELRNDISISQVNTPEGEDVNSLGQAHEKEIFAHLLQSRDILFSSIERKGPAPIKTTSPSQSAGKLEIFPHRFMYRTATANYHIKGDLQSNFESLRVSLDIEHPRNSRKSRSKVDLYEDKQVEKLSRDASDKLGLRADLVLLDLEALTNLLESHRESIFTKLEKEPKQETLQVPLHMQNKCREFPPGALGLSI